MKQSITTNNEYLEMIETLQEDNQMLMKRIRQLEQGGSVDERRSSHLAMKKRKQSFEVVESYDVEAQTYSLEELYGS